MDAFFGASLQFVTLIIAVDAFFGASLQVVALIIAIVCLISSIFGKSYGIGPVQVPAPSDLAPRVALATLGLFLLSFAFWDHLVGKSIPETLHAWFSPPPPPEPFTTDNRAFADLLVAPNTPIVAIRLRADIVYGEAPGAMQRCAVVREIVEVYRQNSDAYPLQMLSDAEKVRQQAPEARSLMECSPEMNKIAALSDGVKQAIAASAPTVPPTLSPTAVMRPKPTIATMDGVSEDLARRVLTATTLTADSGWMFIGFRGKDSPALTADRRIAVNNIPRTGIVATIADSELLDTKDPGIILGTVKGYVRAGSAVEIRAISGPRHYAKGVWDGYDAYALVRVVSLPRTSVEAESRTASATPLTSATVSVVSTSATAAAPCSSLPTPSATLFTHCNEAYPTRFNDYQFHSYRVTDSHSTGIHVRNIGPHPVNVSIFPSCDSSAGCRPIENVLVPPVATKDDGSNDYIYTVETLRPFNYLWSVRIPSPTPSSTANLATAEASSFSVPADFVKPTGAHTP